MFLFGFLVGMGAGGAVVWYGKDTVTKLYLGAEGLAANLQAKVNALKATAPPKV